MSDGWVWLVLSQPPARRRETARDRGRSLAEAVVRANAMLDDDQAWRRWPHELNRWADERSRGHRSRGRVTVRR